MMRLKSAAIADLLSQVSNPAEALLAIKAPMFDAIETAHAKDWRCLIPPHMRNNWALYSVEARLAAYIVALNKTFDER